LLVKAVTKSEVRRGKGKRIREGALTTKPKRKEPSDRGKMGEGRRFRTVF